MNLPNILTSTRLVFAPVFFLLAFSPTWFDAPVLPIYIILVLIFIYIELTDIADGYIARKKNLVTDLGKVLDPFSDVVSRVSYFLAFVVLEIMPPAAFLLILYREIGIIFIRMVLAQKGIALAARKGGKLKSVLYFIASALGLLVLGDAWLDIFGALGASAGFSRTAELLVPGVFWLSAIFAIGSFVDYLLVFRSHIRSDDAADS
jgi:CDP-diacylglycerol--glycerol-3-phosphate 3-phosphatidyltransferase